MPRSPSISRCPRRPRTTWPRPPSRRIPIVIGTTGLDAERHALIRRASENCRCWSRPTCRWRSICSSAWWAAPRPRCPATTTSRSWRRTTGTRRTPRRARRCGSARSRPARAIRTLGDRSASTAGPGSATHAPAGRHRLSSIRAGDIVGEHHVLFAGSGRNAGTGAPGDRPHDFRPWRAGGRALARRPASRASTAWRTCWASEPRPTVVERARLRLVEFRPGLRPPLSESECAGGVRNGSARLNAAPCFGRAAWPGRGETTGDSHACGARPRGRHGVSRRLGRCAGQHHRRSRFQHGDDGLPGDPDRSVLLPPDRHADLSAHRQHRHDARGPGVRRDPRRRAW